ncbi:MAG TPA: exodeoxyribonuclease VII small subunit [Gammaproteobacteria bacterium]|jgi:exodeoxyribonuclease VII small subunit
MAKKSAHPDIKIDFEGAMRELEELVERMEQGDLSLEQSLKDFERGVALTRTCQQALQEAEQKVQILMRKDEEAGLIPFEESDD